MYNAPIVPDDFIVPAWLETSRMRLRSLTIDDAVQDFEAVVTSETRLRTLYDPGSEWPKGLSLSQNMIELAWHQVEFQLRTSFAYTVVPPDESAVLGCLYIYPTAKRGHDVEITMWVRESEASSGHQQAAHPQCVSSHSRVTFAPESVSITIGSTSRYSFSISNPFISGPCLSGVFVNSIVNSPSVTVT